MTCDDDKIYTILILIDVEVELPHKLHDAVHLISFEHVESVDDVIVVITPC